MPKPTSVISFSYGLDANGDPAWQDITSYVNSFSIGRGKSNELDSYSTGSATVVLNNRSRAFEPNYQPSPFNGLIEPYGNLKIVTSGYTQFIGVIDNWSYSYSEKGLDATATIQANDNLTLLAKNVLTAQTFDPELAGTRIKNILYGTDVYYNQPTCINAGTRTMTDDTVAEGDNLLDYVQKVAANDGGLFFARRDGIIAFKDSTFSNTSGLATARKNLCNNSSFEVAVSGSWSGGVRSTGWSEDRSYSYASSNFSPSVTYFETNATKYKIDTTYNISFYVKNGTGASKTLNVNAGMMNGVAANQDTLLRTEITLAANEEKRINLGAFNSGLTTDGIYLSVDQYPLTTANAFYIDAVLIEQNILMNKYFDGASSFTAPANQTYSIGFEGTADNSTSVWQTTVSQIVDFTTYTYVSDANYSGIQFYDVAMNYASEKLYNKVTVVGPFESLAGDAESQAKYGLKELAITDAILDTQTDNDSLAQFLLSLYRIPNYRAESIMIPLHNLSAANQNTMLNMDLLSFIVLQFIPGNSGNTLIKNYQVIGISHMVSLEEHMIELRVSSMDNYGLVLDSGLVGFLGTNRLV